MTIFRIGRGLAILDIDTGEIIGEIDCIDVDQLITAFQETARLSDKTIKGGRPAKYREFYMGYQARQRELLARDDFNHMEAYVFLYLQSSVGFGNRIRRTQKEIAEIMGLSKSTVSKAFATMRKHGVIKRDERIISRVVYKLESEFTVKGRAQLKNTDKIISKTYQTATGVKLVAHKGGAA